MVEIKNNENFYLCSLCNGMCCKRMPGIVSPNQYEEITEELLINLLKNGYQFDYWEGPLTPESTGLTAYYLRPQTVTSIGKVVDASWGGQCIFFIDGKGCTKSFEERPSECQDLVPNETFLCSAPGKSKVERIAEWLPYNNIIEKIINYEKII